MIEKDKLKMYANKLMFDMEECEYETLQKEFDIILKQMDLIGKIENISEVEPMTFPFDLINIEPREDIVCDKLSPENIFKNASSVECDMVKLPKVVE